MTIYVSQLFNNSWQNSEQYFYTYDVLGFPETVIRQVWQGSTWQNSLRRSYSNNNYGTAQLAVFEIWQQGTWVSQNMFTKAIDDYGNVTSSNAYTWNNSWQQNQDNQLEVNYNYGLKTLRFQGYRAEAGFTSMLVGVREKPGTASTKVYPNPANGKLFIINTLLSSDPLDIHIFATDGRKVTELRQPAEPFITLDLEKSGLREGSYIMKISSPEGTSTHRITYLK
ncbi:MAG: T9SS type A sorting domain-containing protein [Bacteroidetes bacterium]|nr:T9SS type A sorting domain-containing protein [Bacteroidota bacterium]